nr:interferon-induced very large GTPase 1-like [Anolis sagrei ordinatus]
MAFETIRREREKLIAFLERAPDLILDDAASQGFISETDYSELDKLQSSKEKMHKLLVKIQRKGEEICHRFLESIRSIFPDLPAALWPPASACSPTECSDVNGSCNCPPAEAVNEKSEPENPDLVISSPVNGSKNSEEDASNTEDLKVDMMEEDIPEGTVKSFLNKLGLSKQSRSKLTMREILEIDSESLKIMAPQKLEDLPWHFLRKLMALNGTARNTSLVPKAEKDSDESMKDEIFCLPEGETEVSSNPLDVLCAILLCSDSFLQQEIFLKMSMCQFALPLILPPLDTPKCTFMLWAMMAIVRKWRPHSLAESRGFREDNLVLISMPTISFVRMGTSSLSKSKLLNEVLSSPQHHHDFFVHRDVDCGNVAREISNGLVEISWYFPAGRENSDLFPEPVAITNLRGDIESHWLQFSFLTEVSTAVFIFVENISESEYNMFLTLQKLASKFYFILNTEGGKSKEALGSLNRLAPLLNLTRSQLLVKEKSQNTTEFVKKLHLAMRNIMTSPQKVMNIEEMSDISRELGIEIDADTQGCQKGTLYAKEITEEIADVADYKKEMLKLQGDLWRTVAKVEKEQCRMKGQADTPTEDYKSQLREKWIQLRAKQNQCDLTDGITKFINGLQHLCPTEKHFFLKLMKFSLDRIARGNLLILQEEYKEKCRTTSNDTEQLKQLDKLISLSSLGVEHFMRELGQFYEAEYMMVKEGRITQGQRQFLHLPAIAADLMLEGFPMELIDGDASNIPLQWVTDVLTELHNKLGGRSRMQILTVLGVQSTGKSTLLNTMFGLQFAVSSGRCTRGAFMTLLRVSENLQQEIGCDFVLVIDTEGLKAPELAKLEDSYEHDNELATLVIGLSDITIVNLAMENATEMKDILQIVVHAFLRMENIGRKPNCQFVHQNVSDVSAHDQNMRDRKHLLEQLNEMTTAAARMEKRHGEVCFSDIMDYAPEKDNWYIPGLWHGVPPMAPVNLGYSESVSELKRYLFDFMRTSSQNRSSKDIPQFAEWIKSLWNAVKHENFIFSFRNSLVANAYNQLSVKYSEWEWDFQKEIYCWVSKAETSIQNRSLEELKDITLDKITLEGYHKLDAGEKEMLQCIQSYFESGGEHLHLIEKYKEEFVRSAKFLRNHLESYLVNKCQETIVIRKEQGKIDHLQAGYFKTMEGKVNKLLEECKERKCKLNSKKLKREFEKMWKETLAELPSTILTHRQINIDVFHQLRKDLECRGGLANQILQELTCISELGKKQFIFKNEHLELTFFKKMKKFIFKDYLGELEFATVPLIEMCRNYVMEKVSLKGDYVETYCRELLWMINQKLEEKDFQKLHITIKFEVEVKYHILQEAAASFQEMHNAFCRANNPHQRLKNLKPHYFSIFKDLYNAKDACQKRAMNFCEVCLEPALVDYLNKRLGIDIVDNFLSSAQSIQYGSRSFFQFMVQKKLLEDENFDDYVKYIRDYKGFVKFWIEEHLVDHYGKSQDLAVLEKEILSAVIKKVKAALASSAEETVTLFEFLECFCQEMSEELVISKDSFDIILFNNTSKVSSFAADVQGYISEVMERILADQSKLDVDMILQAVSFKPQEEIFRRVFGCGKQCPFCKVPCEAGGGNHQEHFASTHRPQGLGQYRCVITKKLNYSLCSSYVTSDATFENMATDWKPHPYKEYRQYYPDWRIQPDASIAASDYWKFIFNKYNQKFAEEYDALPAVLPEDWKRITKQQALESIQEVFNMQ